MGLTVGESFVAASMGEKLIVFDEDDVKQAPYRKTSLCGAETVLIRLKEFLFKLKLKRSLIKVCLSSRVQRSWNSSDLGMLESDLRYGVINKNGLHRRRVIFVSGLVGAGKTTFARALKSYLESQGFKVCVCRVSAFPYMSYAFFRSLACILYGCEAVENYKKINVHPSTLVVLRIRRIPFLMMLLVFYLEIAGTLLRYLGVLLRCRRMNAIIVDEGLINQFANYIEIFGKHSAIFISFIVILFEKLRKMLGFDIDVIFVNVGDYSRLLSRWYKRGHPLPTSFIDVKYHFKYLKFIEISKNIMLKVFNQCIIELNADEKALHELILEYLNSIRRS